MVSSHAPCEVRECVSLMEPPPSTRVHRRIGKEVNIRPEKREVVAMRLKWLELRTSTRGEENK